MEKIMEILAPVGNKEMLDTAIANGADAVYLGLENFNARAKADNFSSDTIAESIDLCHLHGIKVYIAVNTLVSDGEFESVVAMVEKAHIAKADAFIVQDLGLIYFLKKKFPNIEIHASTQCGVCNAYGAQILKKLGATRVVVARETTMEDIKQIKGLGLEVEVFVQGALCVCYSGSCYLSSVLKNKSGNRGECLQLCRLPYKLVQNGVIQKSGYLLSTRDISLLSRLKDFENAGVDSLKIEGRLRRPAYLAQAIQSVKSALADKTCIATEDFKLKKVFSRGEFNKGIYLNTKTSGGITNALTNGHLGVEIGFVKMVKPFKDIFEIQILSKHAIVQNDGLKFVFDNKEQSMGVGSVQKLGNNDYLVYSKTKPIVGAKVYLTVDSKNEETLLARTQKLMVDVKMEVEANENMKLVLSSGDVIVNVEGSVVQEAKNAPLSKDQIMDSVCKFGGTPFALRNVEIKTRNAFVPKSQLNSFRRNAIDKLVNTLIENYEKQNLKPFIKNNDVKFDKEKFSATKCFCIVNNLKQLESVSKYAHIIYAPDVYKLEAIKHFVDKCKEWNSNKVFLYLPVVANFRDIEILDAIVQSFEHEKLGLYAGSIYGVNYVQYGYEVICGTNVNVSNKFAKMALASLGVSGGVGSMETNLFGEIDGMYKFVGKIPLMTLVMCPFIEHCGSTCANCNYKENTELVMDNNATFVIRRQRVADCYFELVQKQKTPQTLSEGLVVDLRD